MGFDKPRKTTSDVSGHSSTGGGTASRFCKALTLGLLAFRGVNGDYGKQTTNALESTSLTRFGKSPISGDREYGTPSTIDSARSTNVDVHSTLSNEEYIDRYVRNLRKNYVTFPADRNNKLSDPKKLLGQSKQIEKRDEANSYNHLTNAIERKSREKLLTSLQENKSFQKCSDYLQSNEKFMHFVAEFLEAADSQSLLENPDFRQGFSDLVKQFKEDDHFAALCDTLNQDALQHIAVLLQKEIIQKNGLNLIKKRADGDLPKFPTLEQMIQDFVDLEQRFAQTKQKQSTDIIRWVTGGMIASGSNYIPIPFKSYWGLVNLPYALGVLLAGAVVSAYRLRQIGAPPLEAPPPYTRNGNQTQQEEH